MRAASFCSDSRTWAIFSRVGTGGSPNCPSSPRVAHTMWIVCPAAASRASVPPAKNDSSSGCATTTKTVILLCAEIIYVKSLYGQQPTQRKDYKYYYSYESLFFVLLWQ